MWSVFFVFLSYLDRNFVTGEFLNDAFDAEKESKETFFALNGTFCAKMSIVGENFLYQVSDGADEVRSVVNPAGKLVDCSVIVNRVQVTSFFHVCKLGSKERGAERRLETPFAQMDDARRMCREFKERSERTGRTEPAVEPPGEDGSDDVMSQVKAGKRAKRGFTYPGTLWCGAGNMADNYDHLGEFAETDSCCRVHDHCPYVIHAFSSNYGYTNFKWHSICHCDCDNVLKECLRNVNDTASRVVGQAFFNVIGVPCFDFAYEEQCAERHWYGMCKRYEKMPVAVMRESVPYDFGGIDVIDVLTVAPPKKEVSEKSNEQEKAESSTQSTVSGSQTSGPEEPSLRNMVTAAEDFIKVLATVSTSQSSTADTTKGETQSSEKKKKKKKKKGKKKKKNSKKHHGKGHGRKRKLKVDTGAKIEEGATVSPSGSKTEEVIDKSNFISEAAKNDQSRRNTNRFIDSKYDYGGREEPSNDVLKDEPMKDEEAADVSVTSVTVQKEQVAQDPNALTLSTEIIPLSTSPSTTTASPHETKAPRSRKGKGRRKNNESAPIHSSVDAVLNITLNEKSLVNITNNLSTISVPSIITITPTAQLEGQKKAIISTASAPIVIPKLKRHRSKERAEGQGRKKRRKTSSAAPIVAFAHENSSVDTLKVITSSAAPNIPSIPTAEPTGRQVSHRPDTYGGRTSVPTTTINSTFSVLKTKRQMSERGQRNIRGKIVHLSSENPPDFQNGSETFWPTVETEGDRGTLTAVTVIPSVIKKRRRPIVREERKSRQKARPTLIPNTHTPMTFTRLNAPTMPSEADKAGELNPQRSESSTPVSSTTTTATPFMRQIQLSIQRAKEQFSRKKRRKATMSRLMQAQNEKAT